MTSSLSRISRQWRAGIVAVALASTAVVAAPASALESTVRNDVCSISLSPYEQETYDNAQRLPNTIDEGSVVRFEVKKKDAESFKKTHLDKLKELEYQRNQMQAELGVGGLGESITQEYEANVKVIDSISTISDDYVRALEACAQGKGYQTDGKAPSNKGKEATSSNMNDQTMYTLWGLLGLAVVTTVAYVLQDLPAKLPGLQLPQFF